MMKLSKYNVYIKEQKDMIIYNTLTGGVLELEQKYWEEVENFRNNKIELSNDLEHNLVKGGMIIADDINEIHLLKMMHMTQKYNNTVVSFTIAPTLECNFCCPYCYEKGHRHNSMTPEVVDKTIQFINSYCKGKKQLDVTWYGGEPLLKLDVIEKITNGIKKEGIEYNAAIVTNGYYLSRDIAKKLVDFSARSVQITLDGPPEIHNKRRRMPNGEDTFYKIVNNIVEACNIIPIVIRINVDKTNIKFVNKIIDVFIEKNVDKKILFYLAPVDEINDNGVIKECMSDQDFSKYQMNFIKRNKQLGIDVYHLPECSPGNCGAVSANSFVIDPLGDLYKCWDEIGIISKKCGSIFNEETITGRYIEWVNYPFIYYKECKECEYLPICLCGCPYHNIEKNSKECHSIKYNAKEMILMLKGHIKNDDICK